MIAYVALGANMRRPLEMIGRAVHAMNEIPLTSVTTVSRIYRTQAVGGPKQSDYLNAVVRLRTKMSSLLLLRQLLAVERRLGRVRRVKWGPRLIDLDLLAYGRKRTVSTSLELPHPRYHERRFVLVPFCDIAPGFIHPRLKTRNRTLLRKLTLHGQRVTMAATWNGTRFSPFSKKRSKKSPSSR